MSGDVRIIGQVVRSEGKEGEVGREGGREGDNQERESRKRGENPNITQYRSVTHYAICHCQTSSICATDVDATHKSWVFTHLFWDYSCGLVVTETLTPNRALPQTT